MFARTMLKAPMMKARTFATGTGAKTFKEKSFKEAWLSDAGAYPVMTVIAGAFCFSLGAGFYFMSTTPDARLAKEKRKSMFRGDLHGVE